MNIYYQPPATAPPHQRQQPERLNFGMLFRPVSSGSESMSSSPSTTTATSPPSSPSPSSSFSTTPSSSSLSPSPTLSSLTSSSVIPPIANAAQGLALLSGLTPLFAGTPRCAPPEPDYNNVPAHCTHQQHQFQPPPHLLQHHHYLQVHQHRHHQTTYPPRQFPSPDVGHAPASSHCGNYPHQLSPPVTTYASYDQSDRRASVPEEAQATPPSATNVKSNKRKRNTYGVRAKRERRKATHVCDHCGAETSPAWRRGPVGWLCNRCGLKYQAAVKAGRRDTMSIAYILN